MDAVEDLKRRIAHARAKGHSGRQREVAFKEPDSSVAALTVDVLDIDAIAARHHQRGYELGGHEARVRIYPVAFDAGRERALHDRSLLLALLAEAMGLRLVTAERRLRGPERAEGQRDPRKKAEIVSIGLTEFEAVRRELIVVVGAAEQGAFDVA